MAIAVSQAYKDVHARRSGKVARVVVQYKRRYFDPDAAAFFHEPVWRVLRQNQIVDPGDIVDQLDVAEPNVFKATTVTLRLNNARNQWVRSVNDPSVFAADATAPQGYYDDRMLVQVLFGHRLPDGTWEDCPQFTGYAYDYTPIPKMGHMEVAVSASLLAEKCGATKINTAVTGEAMASSVVDEPLDPNQGDGTTPLLKTRATGVISVTNVKADGAALTPTTDYTVSIPTDGTQALITLVDPAAQNLKALTWTGVTKYLLTTSAAVTSVDKLYADGVALTQGADYTISIPGNIVGPAQITLLDPPLWIGKAFTWDGTKGALNKKVEEAVALYCEAAGIGAAARQIQPVFFPGGLSASVTLNTPADWQAGTLLQNIDAVSTPGSIFRGWFLIDNFADGDYTANPVWTNACYRGTLSVADGSLALTAAYPGGSRARAYTSLPKSYGAWSWRCTGTLTPYGRYVYFSSTGTDPLSAGGTGYYLLIYNGVLSLMRTEPVAADVTLGTYSNADIANAHRWTVSRTADGTFTVYMDNASVITASDTKWTSADYFHLEANGNPAAFSITDIYYSPQAQPPPFDPSASAAVGEWIFDLQTTPTTLGALDHFEVLNGGTVAYKTACAPDDGGAPGTFEALQSLGAGNQMMSTPARWLKLRVEPSPAAGSLTSPEVQKLVAHFTSSNVTLAQVAPTSGTAWSKIQVYAKMANYETGWDETGIFFFRSRTTSGAAVIDLEPGTNIIDIDDTHPGWDRVFNIGHASQPPYEYYYGKDDAGEVEPTSERRFGPIPRDLNFDGELVANDAQIGRAAAQAAYEDNHRPRWRCRVPSKLIPWLQISDPVNLTMVPDRKLIESYAGDPLQKSGYAGPQGVALAINKKMKIIGRVKRPRSNTADLLLEEILS